MGLMDWLKKKPPRQPLAVSDMSNRSVPKENGPTTDYLFAHVYFRQLALSMPGKILAILATPHATSFLNDVLSDLELKNERKATYKPEQIRLHGVKIHEYPCMILQFPEPENMAEAHMVAVVGLFELSRESFEKRNLPVRYFTLEKGFSEENVQRTVLCEWDDHQHSNYGTGPAPDPNLFAKAIEQIVT